MNVLENQVQIGKRGTVTLPAEWRKRYGPEAGDVLTVIDLGGVFVLSPETSAVSKVAHEIQQLRKEAGLALEELQRVYQEKYGSST
jgi:bifunctional DNA-binding transcriptional regulator/antitoxin component of YhaV-PrlF toxin-antitoxin module